jgi:hypothetical protein
MAKFQERIKARQLRKRGRSVKSIAEELGVSKGSASTWCRDIELTEKQKNRLMKNAIVAGHKGRMIGAEMNRKKKEARIAFHKKSGEKDIGKITRRDLLMVGVALYWGEGVKSHKSALAFVNSDPDTILFMYKWFKEIFDVKMDDFRPRVFINEIHKPRIKKVLNFWSDLLELPIEQFGNPVLLKMKQKKVYENHDKYYGVLSLGVRKGSDLKYRILGLINAMRV